jgi:NADH-quinone oxidoreductase subunit G
MYSADRLMRPMVRENGVWQETDWETALAQVAERLGRVARQHGAAQIGGLASPGSTLEELHLFSRILRGLGSANVDHRLRRTDFRDEAHDPLHPALGCSIEELEAANAVLIVGSNLRKDVPLIAHRIRKAAVRRGASVSFINPRRYEYLFPVAGYLTSNGLDMFEHLAAVLAAAVTTSGAAAPPSVGAIIASAQPTDAHRAIAQQLTAGERRLVLLGAIAQRDPAYADLRLLAGALAQVTGATLGYLPDGGNTVAGHLVGALPHRGLGGRPAQAAGLNVADMLAARLKCYVLLGAIEPQHDIAAQAIEALKAAEYVVALSPYESAKEFAHVILPIGTFAETSGTYVNMEGRWQSVPGAARPVGESRPAWKVLRVLGNLLNLPSFDYTSSDQITAEVQKELAATPAAAIKPTARTLQSKLALNAPASERDVAIYQVDALVRRSSALQSTRDGVGQEARK